MPSYMLLLVMIISLFPISARCGEPDPMIELRVRCFNSDSCGFSGDTIRVELELTNATGEDVALPVEYFRKQGPQVILVDNHSNKEKRLGMGPPMSYLFDQLEVLAPGQSIRIPWSVPAHHVTRFALRPVSVTAIFRFYLAPGSPHPGKEFVRTQMLIEGD